MSASSVFNPLFSQFAGAIAIDHNGLVRLFNINLIIPQNIAFKITTTDALFWHYQRLAKRNKRRGLHFVTLAVTWFQTSSFWWSVAADCNRSDFASLVFSGSPRIGLSMTLPSLSLGNRQDKSRTRLLDWVRASPAPRKTEAIGLRFWWSVRGSKPYAHPESIEITGGWAHHPLSSNHLSNHLRAFS